MNQPQYLYYLDYYNHNGILFLVKCGCGKNQHFCLHPVKAAVFAASDALRVINRGRGKVGGGNCSTLPEDCQKRMILRSHWRQRMNAYPKPNHPTMSRQTWRNRPFGNEGFMVD
ncbi:MAG: hypothetical protein AMJ75_09675 [Phycisphaerae bacterium SM1_79]|nr:MAG: hypothetical protein AMJ75_09675 [Phycisphaerae bacterium SM1_79]